MNRTEAGLLQSVIADPDDDDMRGVYADWLEDHGDSDRAEFIRVQLLLARLPLRAAERAELERRERELLAAHAADWLAPVVHWLNPANALGFLPHRPRWQFRRGFLERLCLTVETFRAHGARILAAAPIREGWFPDCEGRDLAELGEIETLARLRALDLAGATFDDGIDELLYSDNVANLRRLDLYCEVEDEGGGAVFWRPLLTSESLAGLEELLLTYVPMWDEIYGFLATQFALPGLRRLGLEGANPTADQARMLPGCRKMAHVEVLAVTRAGLTPVAEQVLRERFGAGLRINESAPHQPGWKPCF